MPAKASIPGRPHGPGWTAQKPYVCPDDPMPRNTAALDPGVVNERGPERSIMPLGEIHSVPRANPNETPIFRGAGAEGMADDLRTGKLPAAPAAPRARSLPGPKRHR